MTEHVDGGGGVPPAPVNEGQRVPESKEMLGKERAGLQAALLLDGLKPGQGVTLDLKTVRQRIQVENKPPETTKITNGSKHERDEHWKKEEYKELKTFDQRKDKWIEKTNIFLANYKKERPEDADKREAIILKKLGISVDDGAAQVYEDYFVKNKGDIGYFAKKVADELTPEEIKQNTALIETIGKFYGKDSSEVARHLAEGIKNVKDNFQDFAAEAGQQFKEGMDGIDIINGVHTRSGEWEKKEEAKRVEKERLKAEAAAKAEEDRKRAAEVRRVQEEERLTQERVAAAAAADGPPTSEPGETDATIQPPTPEREIVLDEAKLGAIMNKLRASDIGRLGIEVKFTNEEELEIQNLIAKMQIKLALNPKLQELQRLVNQYKGKDKLFDLALKLGSAVIEKPDVSQPTLFITSGVSPRIGVPEETYKLWKVKGNLDAASLLINEYTTKPLDGESANAAYGTSAKDFANLLESGMDLLKKNESGSSMPQEVTPRAEEAPKKVKYFRTTGSTYGCGEDGKLKFPLVNGEKPLKQAAIFVDLASEEEEVFRHIALHDRDEDRTKELQILQQMPDNKLKILGDISEITDADKVFLGIIENGVVKQTKKASTIPVKGKNMFLLRSFENDRGEEIWKRHVSKKVEEIVFEEPVADSTSATPEAIPSVEREPKQETVEYKDGHLALRMTGDPDTKIDFDKWNHRYNPATGTDAIVSTNSGRDYYIAHDQHGTYIVDITETVRSEKLVATRIPDYPVPLASLEWGKPWDIPIVGKTPEVTELLLKYKIAGPGAGVGRELGTDDPFVKYNELLRKYRPSAPEEM